MENGELACSSETPIPKSIALTISTHERKLLSYLRSNKAVAFRTNDPESHNLISGEDAELIQDFDTNSRQADQGETAEAFTQERVKVPDQAQSSPLHLLNKGGGGTVDNDCYRLPPILLHNLMAWVAKFHELRISHPNGTTINATPEHVRDAAKLHPWGVVCDPERCLLLSWGDVPTVTLLGLRDLETGELLIPVQVAA